MIARPALGFALLLTACGGDGSALVVTYGAGGGGAGSGGAPNGGNPAGGFGPMGGSGATGPGGGAPGGGGPCPPDSTCVDAFPFTDTRDTSMEGNTALDAYSCAPMTNEGGPEIAYRVFVPYDGFLSAAVYDEPGVDIDVHILTSLNPDTCLNRGDKQAGAHVNAGTLWVVADTWVNGSGNPLPGPFDIDIGFVPQSEGPCGMQDGELDRIGDGGDPLLLPAVGPVVGEGHLVTADEPPPFPENAADGLGEHYALTQDATAFVMFRELGFRGGNGGFYGSGVGDPAQLSASDEMWTINMMWTSASRPPPGTRMIVRDPMDPERAIVASAGYATGPGNLSQIAGLSEEALFYFGIATGVEMEVGFAVDQALPLGPRRCTD